MADDLGRLRLSESACVLQVDSSANKEEIRPGEEPNDTSSQSSCSGFIVDPREGFILTTGGLFSQVLPAADLQNGIVKGDSHPQGYGIKVFWETKRRGRLKSCRCRLVGLWSCDALADSLNRLFRKSDGWSFEGEIPDEEEDGMAKKNRGVGVSEAKGVKDHEKDISWLSSFALIKADDSLLEDPWR